MTATIFGELTEDGSTIILIGNGPDHELAAAAKHLELLTAKVKNTKPAGALQVPVSWPTLIQLAGTFGAAWTPGPRLKGWIADQVIARTTPTAELAVTPPAGLKPYSWQTSGACLIRATGSSLIFDEPGTGKTITTILGLVERAYAMAPLRLRVVPIVVVCPAAVVDSWVNHFRAWAPQWRVVAWRGTPKARIRLSGLADVYVASYDTARRDAQSNSDPRDSPLLGLRAKSVVADESHKIKSPQAEQSRAVRRLAAKADNFIGLSGTPITHHPADLWPALVALSPNAWPSRERWVNRYCTTLPGDYGQNILGLAPHSEPEFRTTLIGQHRRVAKADVLTELPPKVYTVRSVELPGPYRKAYDSMEKQMLAELPDGQELSVMTVLAQLTRLSQMASSAADVEVTTEVVEDEYGTPIEKIHQKVTLKAPSWKVEELLEVMAERPGQPIVGFAPSRQLMMVAGEAATKAGYKVGYLVGGQSPADRTGNIESFQRGELDLICVTTGAGGVGVTLTAASTAVFLQRPYSLVEALQSEDRLHRIGAEKHKSIEVIDIVAKNTIDTRVRSILRERAGQLADLVQDPRIVAELLGGASVTRLQKAG